MRPIVWLHISDFHLRESQAWAQDIVLSEMCRDIEHRRQAAGTIDFVLATGDLAFAGKSREYEHAARFLDKVVEVAGVARERIFCIPGNHDVDRERQTTCFAGARHTLQSQNAIDSFLGSAEELGTLLLRHENFRRFQSEYFSSQDRQWTPDGLAYVSTISVDNLRIAIIGLNTSWLAEGGLSDHGKLLTGERQVIDAIGVAAAAEADLVIAMGHHPFHLLNDFDRRLVQRRVEERCHFYHCGHLHDPELQDVSRGGTQCLTVAAGASFESRQSNNSYSLVTLDVMQATKTVTTIQFRPTDGTFSYQNNLSLPFTINAKASCDLAHLSAAVLAFDPQLGPVAHYLSALLIEAKTELPISTGDQYVFGSLDLLRAQPESELRTVTISFMALRNPLRLFGGRMELGEFMSRYGEVVKQYGHMLRGMATSTPAFQQRVEIQNAESRALAGTRQPEEYSHTVTLLHELASEHDWISLRDLAERHASSSAPIVSLESQRMLALCLSQSTDLADKKRAISIYNRIVEDEPPNATDFAALASLQTEIGNYKPAKELVLLGMQQFPQSADGFAGIGQRIVESTGDRVFRDSLRALTTEGRKP